MNERIKYLRKELLHLTLDKFGERIGLQKSAISKIEHGKTGLTDQSVKSICREFKVNEAWLRSGEGDVFAETDDDFMAAIDRIMSSEDDARKNLFKFMVSLDEDDLLALRRIFDKAVSFVSSAPDAPKAESSIQDMPEAGSDSQGKPESGPSTLLPDMPEPSYEDMTVEELEAEYKKSVSERVSKTGGIASSTSDGIGKDAG